MVVIIKLTKYVWNWSNGGQKLIQHLLEIGLTWLNLV